jgi:phosphoglycerol transferase
MSRTPDRTDGPVDHCWSKKQIATIGIAVVAIVMYLAFRLTGIQPVVMSDEQRFSTYSRILAPSQAGVPSYLFYFIYRLTNQCGSGFLECGRLLNLLLLGLGSVLLYSLCKQFLTKKTSAFIAVITLLAPWGSYITYYMPEILYYLIFLALTWITLGEPKFRSHALFDCVSGIAFGMLALVKPHAFFLIPAYVAFRVYSHLLDHAPRSWVRLSGSIILTLATLLLTRLALGYLIAGHTSLSLFGSMYGGVADKKNALFHLAALIHVAIGHIYGLLVLLGFPITAAFAVLTSQTSNDNRALKKITFLIAGVLISMLGVTVAYTVQVNGMNPFESLDRLHMRYYFFLFPIFTIVGAFFLTRPETRLADWQRVVVLLVFAATLYAGFLGLRPYTPYAVDAPDLWTITYHPRVLKAFALLQSLALLMFTIRPSAASRLFIYLLTPLLVLNAALAIPEFLSNYRTPNAADRAAMFYEMTIGDRDAVAVVTDDDSAATRVIFHLDAKNIQKILVPASQVLNSQSVAPDVRWIIALNDNPLDPSLLGDLAYDMSGYKIWHVGTGSFDVDFSSSTWPEVESVKGLSEAEPFGRWSNGKTVTILFRKDIPADMSLSMTAFAFGPNVGRAFEIQVGDQVKQLKLGKDIAPVTLDYQNIPEHTRSVIITVPQPVSPKDLGMNTDSRELGIGLGTLSIKPAAH